MGRVLGSEIDASVGISRHPPLPHRTTEIEIVALPHPTGSQGHAGLRTHRGDELRRDRVHGPANERLAWHKQTVGIARRARLLDAGMEVRVFHGERHAGRDTLVETELDAVGDRGAHVEIVDRIRSDRRRGVLDQVAESLVEVRHRDWTALDAHLPAQRAFGLEMGIPRCYATREILEECGLLVSRADRRTQPHLVEPVYGAGSIRRMRPELGVVVEPGAERDRHSSRRNDRLREIAGIVAMRPNRVGERPERRTEFTGPALPLVLVLDPPDYRHSPASVPVQQRARSRAAHVIAAPERAVLAW